MTSHLKSTLTVIAVCVAFAFALTLAPALASAGDITAANVGERIASAKTPAEHQAIADYFSSEAAAEGERVKLHESMLEGYKKAGGKPYQNMIAHSQAMLGESRKLRKDYAAMADLHAKMAKTAKGS